MLPLLRDILHTPVVDMILYLKQSPGMTVRELCTAMNMSYMGVKQHCVELEKKGYLDTWRRPVPHGRPEKLYRLTSKLDPLFPTAGSDLVVELLEQAERIFGLAAPEKLLHTLFQAKSERWAARLAREESIENKVIVLARLRAAEGHMSVAELGAGGALRLVDYHVPLAALVKKHPVIQEIECDLIERLLGHPVERAEEEHSGLKRVIFRVRRA